MRVDNAKELFLGEIGRSSWAITALIEKLKYPSTFIQRDRSVLILCTVQLPFLCSVQLLILELSLFEDRPLSIFGLLS